MTPFPKAKKLTKDRCPACREKALMAIGTDPNDKIIKDNIVVQCTICGTESKLNRASLAADEVAND